MYNEGASSDEDGLKGDSYDDDDEEDDNKDYDDDEEEDGEGDNGYTEEEDDDVLLNSMIEAPGSSSECTGYSCCEFVSGCVDCRDGKQGARDELGSQDEGELRCIHMA